MPTYEYECPKCGHEFEAFTRKITDQSTRKCPQCGGRARRIISGGAGLVFKGEGFYITDYKKKGEKGGEKDGGSSSTKESSSDSSQGSEAD